MSRLKRLLHNAEELDDQFDGYVSGRILLCDADSTVYVASATTSNIETAKTRFCSGVLTAKFLAGAQSVRIELTAAECSKAGRYKLRGVKLYQGNRDKKAKPGLVEPLRKAIGRNMFNVPDGEDWYVHLNFEFEADDTLIMDAWTIGINDAVIYSADKDLRCWPGRFLDPYDNKVLEPCVGIGRLWWHETKSDKSLIGHGPIFFWAQMLMGDSADNIAGVKKIGKQTAYDMLVDYQEIDDESVVAELVLREYMQRDQNPWPEAVALWLYRTPTYSFAAHLNTLTLSKELRVWLHKKLGEEWYAESDWRDSVAASEECDGLQLPTL
ncbi:exonuclease [Kosakonia virus Kc261]|uniref:Exonuclease n=1 Tax=Kosakonia virus Kc261 TaxID=2797326 RepID=A0AAE7P5H6_9CAUD|nr:exonuclease [Kosakonia virus Kc261]